MTSFRRVRAAATAEMAAAPSRVPGDRAEARSHRAPWVLWIGRVCVGLVCVTLVACDAAMDDGSLDGPAHVVQVGVGNTQVDHGPFETTHAELRPTEGEGHLGNGYGDVEVRYLDSPLGHVRVWWASEGPHRPPVVDTNESGVPDFVELVARIGDEVVTYLIDNGWRRALSDALYNDGGDYGGAENFDIYLVDIRNGDGYFVAEGCRDEGVRVCSGYVAIENDFFGHGYRSLEEAAKVLVSHEYFHAVQAAYRADLPVWFSEGTATWFEEEFYPDQDDFERLAATYFRDPGRSLNSRVRGPTDVFAYGTAIFFDAVARVMGPETIRHMLEALGRGASAEAALVEAIEFGGVSFDEMFRVFSVWAFGTGRRAVDGRGFPQSARYPALPVQEIDADRATNWDLELGPLSNEAALLTFSRAISVEVRPLDGRGDAPIYTILGAERWDEDDGEALSPMDTLVLYPDASPAMVVVANADTAERRVGRLAIRAAPTNDDDSTDAGDGTDVGDDAQDGDVQDGDAQDGDARHDENGCSVARNQGSPAWLGVVLFALLGVGRARGAGARPTPSPDPPRSAIVRTKRTRRARPSP